MAGAAGALDGIARHPHAAGAGEGVAVADHALLQGGGQDQGLEGGAGLIGVVDGLVAPLVQLSLAQGLQVLVAVLAVGGLEGVQLSLDVRVTDDAGVVQVVAWGVGPGQDGPGVRVHGDAEAAVLDLEGLDALFQDALAVALDGGVQGEDNVVAVGGVVVVLVAGEHFSAVAVAGGDHPAHLAGELLLVEGLDAVGAAVGVDKADDLAGQGVLRIIALAGGGDDDGVGQSVVRDELPHLVGHLLLSLAGKHLIGRVGPLQPRRDVLLINAQNLREALGHQLIGRLRRGGHLVGVSPRLLHPLGIVFLDLDQVPRGDNDPVDGGAHGQGVPVAVVDGAPVGLHRHIPGLLVDGQFLVIVVLYDLDLVECHQQGDERQDAEHHQKDDGAPQNGPVAPAVALRMACVFSVLPGHGHILSLAVSRGAVSLSGSGPPPSFELVLLFCLYRVRA